jgi:hypothetical protein
VNSSRSLRRLGLKLLALLNPEESELAKRVIPNGRGTPVGTKP